MISEKQKKILSEFETTINLPEGFYFKLLEDDDWSFIIKLHSLIEAAISYSLSESIKIAFSKYHPEGKINLTKVFSLLETSNKNYGKLAFLKALDIPHSKYRGFVLHLSQMRNKMIHNVSNVSMTIKEYYSSLETDKEDFLDKMTFTIDGKVEFKSEKLDKYQLFNLDPKIAIWYNSLECILELYSLVKIFELSNKIETLEKQNAEVEKKFFEKLSPIIATYLESKNT